MNSDNLPAFWVTFAHKVKKGVVFASDLVCFSGDLCLQSHWLYRQKSPENDISGDLRYTSQRKYNNQVTLCCKVIDFTDLGTKSPEMQHRFWSTATRVSRSKIHGNVALAVMCVAVKNISWHSCRSRPKSMLYFKWLGEKMVSHLTYRW